MNVPLLDLAAQLKGIEAELKEAVLSVIDSNQFIMGPQVGELETAIAEYCETSYAVGVSSGTDALLIALMALDIRPGDLVITTPYSFFATAGTVARLGARSVFVDIDPDSYNLSAEKLAEWFSANPEDAKKVKALLPVHLYGQCADMDAILSLAATHGIPVIEDAAQAIGARYKSTSGVRLAGSMGDFGCFSFFPSKNLGGIGDGGMVVTNSEAHAKKLRMLRNHGAHEKYFHDIVGGNFRLDTLQAAALLVKLPHLDSWHERRQTNAAFYDDKFSNTPLKTPVFKERVHHIYNQYVLSVSERRDELLEYLIAHSIGCAIYYPLSFHEQKCFADLGYKKGDFPASEYAAQHTIAIPIYPELTTEMQSYVVDKIKEFYGY